MKSYSVGLRIYKMKPCTHRTFSLSPSPTSHLQHTPLFSLSLFHFAVHNLSSFRSSSLPLHQTSHTLLSVCSLTLDVVVYAGARPGCQALPAVFTVVSASYASQTARHSFVHSAARRAPSTVLAASFVATCAQLLRLVPCNFTFTVPCLVTSATTGPTEPILCECATKGPPLKILDPTAPFRILWQQQHLVRVCCSLSDGESSSRVWVLYYPWSCLLERLG